MRALRFDRLAAALVATLVAAFAGACDDDAPPPDTGTATLQHDQGVDFGSGRTVTPGNFGNADVYVTTNGDSGMKLATGGSSPVDNRPITWFRTGGGLPAEFADLAAVPSAPEPTTFDANLHVKVGQGFLVKTKRGDLVRGFVASADATTISLAWARVVAP